MRITRLNLFMYEMYNSTTLLILQESSLIQDLQPRIDAICDTLNSSLDDSLLSALKERHRLS